MRSPFRYTPSGRSVARKGCWGIGVGGPSSEYTSGSTLLGLPKRLLKRCRKPLILYSLMRDQTRGTALSLDVAPTEETSPVKHASSPLRQKRSLPQPPNMLGLRPRVVTFLVPSDIHTRRPFFLSPADCRFCQSDLVFLLGRCHNYKGFPRTHRLLRPARSLLKHRLQNQAPAICGSRIRASSQQVMASSRRPRLARSPPLLNHQPAAFARPG